METAKMKSSHKMIWKYQVAFWLEQGFTEEEAIKKANQKIQRVEKLAKKVSRY